MNDEMTLRRLKALADPTRLHIVTLLSSCCCEVATIHDDGAVEGPTAGEICCHITGADKITSTISHHLHELEAAGILRLTKRGKTTVCALVPDALESLSRHLGILARGEGKCLCC